MRILIFGAGSAIASEAARAWAERGDSLFLVARDRRKLAALKADLLARGAAKVEALVCGAEDEKAHAGLPAKAAKALGGLDAALIAHGVLPDEERCHGDAGYALETLRVNFSSVVSVGTPLAAFFEAQRAGVLGIISSVAGDRGRASNATYGAAKAGVSAWASGQRARLSKSGVQVVTLKPGTVDSPMTAHLKKGPLFASARKVGRGVVKAMDRRKDTAYLPGYWKLIMLGVIHMPEFIFKKLKF